MEQILAQTIIDVKVILSEINENRYNHIFLFLDSGSLEISLASDTDELKVDYQDGNFFKPNELNGKSPDWSSEVIGKKIISFWNTTNAAGYSDVYILGLNTFKPNFIIYCLANEINIKLW
jgi:hypothetical protein